MCSFRRTPVQTPYYGVLCPYGSSPKCSHCMLAPSARPVTSRYQCAMSRRKLVRSHGFYHWIARKLESTIGHRGTPLWGLQTTLGLCENEEKWRFSTNKLLNIEMIEDSYALYYNGRLIGSRIWPFDLYHFRSPWMTWTTDTQQHQHGHYLTICSFFSGTCTVA